MGAGGWLCGLYERTSGITFKQLQALGEAQGRGDAAEASKDFIRFNREPLHQ